MLYTRRVKPLTITTLIGVALAALVVAAALTGKSRASAAVPLETMTTPEGTVINIYSSRVSASDVYRTLLANGLQSWIGLARVDVVDTGLTMSSVGGGTSTSTDGRVTYFASPAAMQINANDFLAHPNYSVGHEYGHVWANYYLWTYWQDSWAAYLAARGLTGDPRLDSGGCWYITEMIADDYRQFFGAPETTTGVVVVNCNTDIPPASGVAGLKDFLALTWTEGHPPPNYGGSPTTPTPTSAPTMTPTPTATLFVPSPTPTRTPTPTGTRTPTPTPTATLLVPSPTPTPTPTGIPTSAMVQIDRGWHSFLAPISGTTDVKVYLASGRRAVAVAAVTRGYTYWAKGPLTVIITGY